MPGITQYLFETTLCLIIFYGFYHFFLRKKFLTQWNRWFLLLTPVLSLIIPGLDLISFLQEFFYATNSENILLSQTNDFNLAIADQLEERTPPFQLKINDLFKGIYLFGVALLGFRFIDKYWKWVTIFQKKKPNWYVGYTLDNPYEKFPNTSLFSFLFWNKKLLSEALKNQLQSRKINLDWKNSLDVILMNVLVIGMWFHPAIYLFKKELHGWHEENLISHLNFERTFFTPYRNIVLSFFPLLFLLGLFSTNMTEKVPLFLRINDGFEELESYSNFVIYEYEKEKPAAYQLKWGEMVIPLENVAAPNGFSGEITLELNEFETVLDSSVLVFKDDQQQFFRTLDMELTKVDSKRTIWFPNQNPDSIKFESRWRKKIIYDVEKGDKISLTGKVGDIFLANVKINIQDPFELYEPEIFVPVINQNRPSFEFQVINIPHQKSKIRIDTLNPNTKHILDLYRDANKYKILHIPNFKTNERLISSENILFPNVDDEVMTDESIEDIYEFPDYLGYQDKLVRLYWGKMIAAPISKNYTKAKFRSNFRRNLKLKVSNEFIELISLRMILTSKDEHPKSYYLDVEKMDVMDYDFGKLMPESTVYFENIAVKVDGQIMRFPISFMFNIGIKTNEYELAISESQPGLAKDARKDIGYLYYQNYSLSELAGLLSGDERLVFPPNFKEPILDVLFQSSNLPASKGEYLILQKLREQYSYPTELKYDSRTVYIIQPPENPSILDDYEYFYKIRPNLEKIIKSNKRKGLETITPGFFDDLAQLIEDRFGVYVFNESNIEKAYGLGLDLSSFDALRKQLKRDYGIEFKEEKRTVRTLNVPVF